LRGWRFSCVVPIAAGDVSPNNTSCGVRIRVNDAYKN
jgi:hypothetical protein